MASVVVCGGSVVGLTTGLLLARAGHRVVVLERDAEQPPRPDLAWDWSRKGVAQFRQPHNLLPRFQRVLDAELPDVTAALLDAGCRPGSALAALPPGIADRAARQGTSGSARSTADARWSRPSSRRSPQPSPGWRSAGASP